MCPIECLRLRDALHTLNKITDFVYILSGFVCILDATANINSPRMDLGNRIGNIIWS